MSSIVWGGLDLNRHMNALSNQSQEIARTTTEKYTAAHYCSPLHYLAFRVINAVKSLFGCSEWQKGVSSIAKKELSDFSTKSEYLAAKTLFISGLLEGVLMQRQKPEDDFGYEFEIKNKVMPMLHRAEDMMKAAVSEGDREHLLGHVQRYSVTANGFTYWDGLRNL